MKKLAVFVFALLFSLQTGHAQRSPTNAGMSSAAQTLHQDLRKLWTDHVVWTRDYIIAAVGGYPDQQAAANRLLRNQEDIGAPSRFITGNPQAIS
jgi:hypothetical protein